MPFHPCVNGRAVVCQLVESYIQPGCVLTMISKSPFTVAHPSKVDCGLRVRFKTSSGVTELSQHEADGGKFQEREGVAVEIFPILGETATTIEPCNGSLDDPTLG